MDTFTQGFILQSSLILALGAQNLFVLDCGLKRQRHILIASISSACDVILILAGVLGAASIFIEFPILRAICGVLGITFLFVFGIAKLQEAVRGKLLISKESNQRMSASKAVILSLSFSLLNPHALLDTLVLIGGYSTKFSLIDDRFYFGLGAGMFSTIWFFGLALLSSQMNKLLSNATAMRSVALVSGCILIWLSYKLGTDVAEWIKLLA